ncbi:MAG: hypothetical protein ACLS4S_00595 [Bacteroides nordii]
MKLNDWLAIIGALGGLEVIKWIINFFVNRKTNARKEDATADSMEIQNLLNVIDSLTLQLENSDRRTKERDVKVDYVYGELRKEQSDKLGLLRQKHEIELKLKEAEMKRCDVRGCTDRVPPSDY